MQEYGYDVISKRVLMSLNEFIFDDFIFYSEEHRDVFWSMYRRWIKNADKKDFNKIAVIYLLSTKKVFGTVLANYVSNPHYVLLPILKNCNGEEEYNIYHAAKMSAGLENGITEEDLLDDGVI